jgi:hypothetical protein
LRLRGLFIGAKQALDILEKLEVSLLVGVGDRKLNPRRKMIPNSPKFKVFYCGALLAYQTFELGKSYFTMICSILS